MTRLEPAATIEAIVGARRDPTLHIAHAVSATQRVYILHSLACLAGYPDPRRCPFSIALDNGIDLELWGNWQDAPVVIGIDPDARTIHPVLTSTGWPIVPGPWGGPSSPTPAYGQVWETPDGHELFVLSDPAPMTVRGRRAVAVRTYTQRIGTRSVAGFARLKLVDEARCWGCWVAGPRSCDRGGTDPRTKADHLRRKAADAAFVEQRRADIASGKFKVRGSR